jgi:hypothetical protein
LREKVDVNGLFPDPSPLSAPVSLFTYFAPAGVVEKDMIRKRKEGGRVNFLGMKSEGI